MVMLDTYTLNLIGMLDHIKKNLYYYPIRIHLFINLKIIIQYKEYIIVINWNFLLILYAFRPNYNKKRKIIFNILKFIKKYSSVLKQFQYM